MATDSNRPITFEEFQQTEQYKEYVRQAIALGLTEHAAACHLEATAHTIGILVQKGNTVEEACKIYKKLWDDETGTKQ